VGLLRVILVACYLKLLDLSEWLHVIWGCLLLLCEWSLIGSCLVYVSGLILSGAAFVFFDWRVAWNSFICLSNVILLGNGLFYLSGFLLPRVASSYLE